MLMVLLERPRFRTELIKSTFNPNGVATQRAMYKAKKILFSLGLVEEETRTKLNPRLYLSLTEKGKAVAEYLKAIQDLLTSP